MSPRAPTESAPSRREGRPSPTAGRARPAAAGLDLQVWPRATATGARNMALDESAMAVARDGAAVLRLYGWEPACVSLGRNQPTVGTLGGRPRAGLRPGLDVVRRPTGGRAVYHGPELTYAVVLPERWLGGPRAIYAAVHDALREALAGLGVPLDAAPPVEAGPALDTAECFVAPAPGEILAGGRKLVGSAQWRHRGAVLQHGSILIENAQARATPSGDGGRRAVGLAELLDPPPVARLADAVVRAVEARLRATASPGEPGAAVAARADELERRYASAAWTWRR